MKSRPPSAPQWNLESLEVAVTAPLWAADLVHAWAKGVGRGGYEVEEMGATLAPPGGLVRHGCDASEFRSHDPVKGTIEYPLEDYLAAAGIPCHISRPNTAESYPELERRWMDESGRACSQSVRLDRVLSGVDNMLSAHGAGGDDLDTLVNALARQLAGLRHPPREEALEVWCPPAGAEAVKAAVMRLARRHEAPSPAMRDAVWETARRESELRGRAPRAQAPAGSTEGPGL